MSEHHKRGEYVVFEEMLWRVDAIHLSNNICHACPDTHDDYELSRLRIGERRERIRPTNTRTRGCLVSTP